MRLTTSYLGLTLNNPFVVGASPFCDDPFVARQLQDAGAGAVVMRSLFEEQIVREQRAFVHHLETPGHAEAASYFPKIDEYQLTPDRYLRQIERLKQTLSIPVIASLNGAQPGGWTDYAKKFEAAGADAIELNLYRLVTDPAVSADEVEADMLHTVRDVVGAVKIPVAAKISSFHTSPVQFAVALELAGASGVVLFNRFYQPDFNLDDLEVVPQLKLSHPSAELLLRLRWLAIISPHLRGSLSATGGVHTAEQAIKALLAGAHTVQIVSALLQHGPRYLTALLNGVRQWMKDRDYASLDQVRGAMNLARCPNPEEFERANYIQILQSWRV